MIEDSEGSSVAVESTQSSQSMCSGMTPEIVGSIHKSSILSKAYYELAKPIPDIDGASNMIVRGFKNGAKVCQFVSP